jgi:hypothetical protein
MIISNSFFVQVIEDGSMLRGEIRSTQPLAQAYNDGSCIPNWSNGVANPTVYIVLQNGAQYIIPDSGGKWYYNGTEIEFDAQGKSLAHPSGLAAGTFELVTDFTPEMYQSGQYVPAIRIAKNVASNENVNIDVIRYDGQKTLATNPVPFSASININITEMMKGGYIGMIYLRDGAADKDISSKTDTVPLVARLFDSEGNEMTNAENGAKYKWFINDTVKIALGATNTLTITEQDVYDYAVVKCEFYIPKDGEQGQKVDTLVSSDFFEIDDTQDPQEMYFAYNGANGKAASLHSGESVTFNIWVGEAGNPSASNVDTAFTAWKVLLVDSNKQVLMQSLSKYGIDTADANGYRALAVSNGVASITVSFELAATTAAGGSDSGGIRGYVVAQTNN